MAILPNEIYRFNAIPIKTSKALSPTRTNSSKTYGITKEPE